MLTALSAAPLRFGRRDQARVLVASAAALFLICGSFAAVRAVTPIWVQQGYLKSSNAAKSDQFGYAVDIDGDTAVYGTPYHGANDAGAAYVFTRSGSSWTQQAVLRASNLGADDWFGWSVAINGGSIVVGAPHEDAADNSTSNAGGVYVFTGSGASWSLQDVVRASNKGVDDNFGTSVAIDGDSLMVGAYGEDSNATGVGGSGTDDGSKNDSGAAYVFIRNAGTWTEQAYLKASNTGAFDDFGRSVAIDADTAVVGATGESSNAPGVNGNQADNHFFAAGAAYVFTRSGTTWSQQAYVKSSNPEEDDTFGQAVGIDGNTVVVGAPYEDSATTGVNNGGQSDNSALDAGAAYVFTRSEGAWTQQAYVKASNTGQDDQFGTSVGLSGNRVVIGAIGEASNATAVNGTQTNNSQPYSGADYVLSRSGSTWSQDAYLKASNTLGGYQFGWSVAIDGTTLVSGSNHEYRADYNTFANAGAGYAFALTTPTEPDTTITKGPHGLIATARPTFEFTSGKANATFECRVDTGAFGDCSTPYTTSALTQGQHTFAVRAVSNGLSDSTPATRQFTVDTVAPTVGQVLTALPLGGQVHSVPVRLSWTANDAQTAGPDRAFTVEQRVQQNGTWGAWTSIGTEKGATVRILALSQLGRNVQFRIQATDRAGNDSAWATSAVGRFALRESQTADAFTGRWTTVSRSAASGGSVSRSSTHGSTATFNVNGTGFAVVMKAASGLGTVSACVDPGTAQSSCIQVNLGTFTPAGERRLVAVFNGLAAGSHVLRISVVSGSVDLDGVVAQH